MNYQKFKKQSHVLGMEVQLWKIIRRSPLLLKINGCTGRRYPSANGIRMGINPASKFFYKSVKSRALRNEIRGIKEAMEIGLSLRQRSVKHSKTTLRVF